MLKISSVLYGAEHYTMHDTSKHDPNTNLPNTENYNESEE